METVNLWLLNNTTLHNTATSFITFSNKDKVLPVIVKKCHFLPHDGIK